MKEICVLAWLFGGHLSTCSLKCQKIPNLILPTGFPPFHWFVVEWCAAHILYHASSGISSLGSCSHLFFTYEGEHFLASIRTRYMVDERKLKLVTEPSTQPGESCLRSRRVFGSDSHTNRSVVGTGGSSCWTFKKKKLQTKQTCTLLHMRLRSCIHVFNMVHYHMLEIWVWALVDQKKTGDVFSLTTFIDFPPPETKTCHIHVDCHWMVANSLSRTKVEP